MSIMPLTAALLLSNRALWEPAHACIQNLPVRIALEQHEAGLLEALLDRLELHRVDVVLVEMATLPVPLEEFARRVRETSSAPAIFVLHPEASVKHIMDAIHAGATEFLHPPLADALRQAFERLAAARQRASAASGGGLGRAFGFLSVKGGCGATTFASHTAITIARQTQRPVMLGDFDFEAGLMRFLFKSRNSYSVRDAIDNMHRMDANYWKALVSTYGNLVDVLPSPDDVAGRRAGTAQETSHLLRFVRSTYDVSIFDFGRYFSAPALDSLPELETLYLITTMDLHSLEQTRECLFAVAARDFASRVRVLVNQVASDRGAPDPTGVESFVGAPVAGVFSSDPESLYEAWSEGHFLTTKAKLGKELHALAQSMLSQHPPQQQPQPAEKAPAKAENKGWLSFIRRGRG
jgi:pilus assembly protein CpaE